MGSSKDARPDGKHPDGHDGAMPTWQQQLVIMQGRVCKHYMPQLVRMLSQRHRVLLWLSCWLAWSSAVRAGLGAAKTSLANTCDSIGAHPLA